MRRARGAISSAFVVSVAALLAAAGAFSGVISAYNLYLQKLPIFPEDGRSLRDLPTQTRSFVQLGADAVYPREFIDVLGTENYVTRTYVARTTPEGQRPVRLELHAAYYTGMIDTVPHVQERCMVGAGFQLISSGAIVPLNLDATEWREDPDVPAELRGRVFRTTAFSVDNPQETDPGRIVLVRQRDVTLPRDPRGIAMRMSEFAARGGGRYFGGYFFVANGGWTPSAEQVRLLAFDLKDDYAYYMKVQVGSPDVASAEELAEHSARLLDELLPHLMTCVPDWTRVQAGEYPPDNPRRARVEGAPAPRD